jgi:hypothetical protein
LTLFSLEISQQGFFVFQKKKLTVYTPAMNRVIQDMSRKWMALSKLRSARSPQLALDHCSSTFTG